MRRMDRDRSVPVVAIAAVVVADAAAVELPRRIPFYVLHLPVSRKRFQ